MTAWGVAPAAGASATAAAAAPGWRSSSSAAPAPTPRPQARLFARDRRRTCSRRRRASRAATFSGGVIVACRCAGRCGIPREDGPHVRALRRTDRARVSPASARQRGRPTVRGGCADEPRSGPDVRGVRARRRSTSSSSAARTRAVPGELPYVDCIYECDVCGHERVWGNEPREETAYGLRAGRRGARARGRQARDAPRALPGLPRRRASIAPSAATTARSGCSTARTRAGPTARSRASSAGERVTARRPPSPRNRGHRGHRGPGGARPRFQAGFRGARRVPGLAGGPGTGTGDGPREATVTVQEMLVAPRAGLEDALGMDGALPGARGLAAEPQRRRRGRRPHPPALLRRLRAERDRRRAADRGADLFAEPVAAARVRRRDRRRRCPRRRSPAVAAWLRQARALPDAEVARIFGAATRGPATPSCSGTATPTAGSSTTSSGRSATARSSGGCRAGARARCTGWAICRRTTASASSSWRASSISTLCAPSGSRRSCPCRTAPARG